MLLLAGGSLAIAVRQLVVQGILLRALQNRLHRSLIQVLNALARNSSIVGFRAHSLTAVNCRRIALLHWRAVDVCGAVFIGRILY